MLSFHQHENGKSEKKKDNRLKEMWFFIFIALSIFSLWWNSTTFTKYYHYITIYYHYITVIAEDSHKNQEI